MTRKQRRLTIIGVCGLVLAVAALLITNAMRDSLVFFHAPTAVKDKGIKPETRFRLGGLVESGTVVRGPGQRLEFTVTDTANTVRVVYSGLIPDLFREGQGVVTEGKLNAAGVFQADSLLARHDENYMPREVADAIKQQGQWKPGEGKARP
jgi:cytochrome c-type biogenesis protein CcmE